MLGRSKAARKGAKDTRLRVSCAGFSDRNAVVNLVKAAGMRYSSSVSASTDYLIADDGVDAGLVQKARRYGIKIVSLEEFIDLVEASGRDARNKAVAKPAQADKREIPIEADFSLRCAEMLVKKLQQEIDAYSKGAASREWFGKLVATTWSAMVSCYEEKPK